MHRKNLYSDVAVELNVPREVDDSHSSPAQLSLKGVFSRESGLEIEEFVGGLRHVLRIYEGYFMIQSNPLTL